MFSDCVHRILGTFILGGIFDNPLYEELCPLWNSKDPRRRTGLQWHLMTLCTTFEDPSLTLRSTRYMEVFGGSCPAQKTPMESINCRRYM